MHTNHERAEQKIKQAAKAQWNMLWKARHNLGRLKAKHRRRLNHWQRTIEKWRPCGMMAVIFPKGGQANRGKGLIVYLEHTGN